MRQTKIIATVGPACQEEAILRSLAEHGVNIFRLNFSHNTHEWQGEMIRRIRQMEGAFPHPFGLMLDTKGPEIRTCDLKSPVHLEEGKEVILTVESVDYETSGKIEVNYDGFPKDVKEGDKILVDNGTLNLLVKSKKGKDVVCEVLNDGILRSRRHINLPGVDPSLDTITEQDWEDIRFGIKQGVDMVAVSFTRRAEDIETLQDYLKKRKSAHIQVIAKIESFEAVKNLAEIAKVADGLMVARGDLGAEVPFEQVPRIQREIIYAGAREKIPVIVATHMLESMIHNPVPTRAEVTDIAYAVWGQADAVMLSGETASGEYPIESVEAMNRVARETEKDYVLHAPIRDLPVGEDKEMFAKLAAELTEETLDVECIVVISESGKMARIVSAYRPRLPILCCTEDEDVVRSSQLLRGVSGYEIEFDHIVPEETVRHAEKAILKVHPTLKNKKYLLVSDFLENKKFVPTLQIRTMDGK